MKNNSKYPADIFVSLQDLLRMEHIASGFSFLAKKQKVRSILGGKHASKLRGRGLDFEEVRNYVAGDDIRNIDWKVTARTQKTHTKVFSEEKEKPALIVVDQSKSMFFGSQKKMKSVVAAELAALAAFRILKEGDRVGGVVFADDGIDIVFPKRDRKNIVRFLEKIVTRNRELATSIPLDFQASLKEVFAKIRNIVTHDFLVIIIGDFHRYSPEVVKSIIQISQHNDVILSKVYDLMERTIPSTSLIAGDGEKQLVIDGRNKQITANFEKGFDQDFAEFSAQMKKHRIPIILTDTVTNVEEQLKETLKGRKK
ncbi:Protein of unknown function DUF58 [Lutibacter agarilyticus]|uniref:DUF58 domain-containing protein n=1 Tax=Lutibacter agarilyticus TaxID=1109740 RepID=A0A238Y0P0_9FLAO|nr:DUF58 domain-containing protein [Lutibacter agarilyticus]SNR64795.1 Protein of unknown function DUF58 [Lutibacter agarilyticus]